MLRGYISKQYYLELDTDTAVESFPARKRVETLSLVDELKKNIKVNYLR